MNKRISFHQLSPLMLEILNQEGEIIFTITGNSMLPMLRHRQDQVRLSRKPQRLLKKYDLPLFIRDDGTFILHRIVSVKPEGYTVIGDHQYAREYRVKHDSILGIVTGFWHNGKYISCTNPAYRVYCILWVKLYPARYLLHKIRRIFTKFLKCFRA